MMGLQIWPVNFLAFAHIFKPKFLKPIMSTDCYAHCLNLAVVKSCQLPIVRNTIDTVKDVSYAFHYSSKRTGRFKTMLQQANEEQLDALDGQRKIKGLCET